MPARQQQPKSKPARCGCRVTGGSSEYAQRVAEVTVIIPSINSRPKLLPLAIASIRRAGEAEVVLIGPSAEVFSAEVVAAVDRFVPEVNGEPLATKIHHGLQAATTEFQGWLGDDDLLTDGAIDRAVSYLRANPDAVAVFGGCQYIDADGNPLVLNPSGSWAVDLLRFGPQLIPQPSVIWRTDAYRRTKGLSPKYDLAFDFDILVQLSKLGRIGYLPEVQSCFRWHPDSLSVKRRMQSVLEASRVRRSYYPSGLRLVLWPWEWAVIFATWAAGKLLNLRLRRLVSKPQFRSGSS